MIQQPAVPTQRVHNITLGSHESTWSPWAPAEMPGCVSIAANHKPPCNGTHTSRVAEPRAGHRCRVADRKQMACWEKNRKKRAGGERKKKHAKEGQRERFPPSLPPSLRHPSILGWREEEDCGRAGVWRLDLRALAGDQSDGLLWELFK